MDAPVAVIEAIAWHPARALLYALWLASLAWFGWAMLRGPGRAAASAAPIPEAG